MASTAAPGVSAPPSALAGAIATWVIADYGWRVAFVIPAAVALIAIYVRSDRYGRKPAFYIMLTEGAVFITLWIFAESNTALWVYGLLWSIGFLGFWAVTTTLTAEIYPTRIRGVGNGFTWAVAWFVGFVLWPFVTVWLTERTGSFSASFLAVPIAMACMGLGIWRFTPDHVGKELDTIGT